MALEVGIGVGRDPYAVPGAFGEERLGPFQHHGRVQGPVEADRPVVVGAGPGLGRGEEEEPAVVLEMPQIIRSG